MSDLWKLFMEYSDVIGPVPTPCDFESLNKEQRLALWHLLRNVRAELSRIDQTSNQEEPSRRDGRPGLLSLS